MGSSLEAARNLFFQGVEHFEKGRLEAARTAFEGSLALAPGRPSVLGNLGITLFRLGSFKDAVPLLRQATAGDPAYADGWACLALTHEALAQWQDMASALERACSLRPQQAQYWFKRGQVLLRMGQAKPALQALDRAVEIDPEYADAWCARGSLLRELNRLPEAATCFEHALACGGDQELNTYYLDSVRNTSAPPPRRYVEGLFDDYAQDFQSHVVEQLRYQGHERLLRPLLESGRRFHRALDLGCGTGLCAQLLHPVADAIDGVDISQAMLDEARKAGLYRHLTHADIAVYLQEEIVSADLVSAADVFIYVGDLDIVFRSVRRILAPEGCFAFTVEAGDDQDLRLMPSLRYTHSESYVRNLAAKYGFHIDRIDRAAIRFDQTRPIEGLYVYLR
ncbi:tetratricopeptide repeat protein [Oxalobacteraceae bacterium R-40]|uniref:Tetratricopeptide repeat protein n=1 Tax=Keguizhuia sedimenti TaxID=3064264 RepID=A0ABU1BPN0_9BURK|nr:tetratricopeptide repeat protein [Oxalobacteraceae bacterium R-40]